jgi:hypothetical protein
VAVVSAGKKTGAVAVAALLLLIGAGAWGVWSVSGGGGESESGAGGDAVAGAEQENASERGDAVTRATAARSRGRSPEGRGDAAARPEAGSAEGTGRAGDPGDRPGAAAGTDEPRTRRPPTPEEEAADASGAPRKIRGTVVDLNTGEPLGGARTLYCVLDGDRWIGWNGSTVEDDGSFEVNRPPWGLKEGQRYELWVSRPGYRMQRIPVADAHLDLKLEPLDVAPLPGRVVGTWTDAEGKPLRGVFSLVGHDEAATYTDQWVVADAAGRFVAEGVAPGHWQLVAVDVNTYGVRTDALVPEDGETRVELRMRHTAAELEQQRNKISAEEFERRREELRRAVAEAIERGEPENGRVVRKLMFQLQELSASRHASLPTRTVVVTGLPDAPGAHVRAEQRVRHFFREPVVNGRVQFDHLGLRKWTIVLQRPGEKDVSKVLELKPGTGPVTIDFDMAAKASGD